MKTPKFTPGPWSVATYDREPNEVAITTKRFTLALLNQEYFDTQLSLETVNQNARLIAAAPEMYGALEKALDYLEAPGGVHPHFTIGMLETLLAKVRGDE